MSEGAEGQVKSDIPQEGDTEKDTIEEASRFRSYYEDTKNKAKAKQKFKVGRVVWLKTDLDGSYRMSITEAGYDPGANTWSYKLKDSMNEDYEGWVAETKLTAANPNK